MSRFSAPPDVVFWCQRTPDHGDCVVAALAMACGVTYEVALTASAQVEPNCLRDGINWPQVMEILETLGFEGQRVRTRKVDLEEDSGILHVYTPGKLATTSHAVYLWEGRILEPMTGRQQLWLTPKEYLARYKYRAGSMIKVQQKED